MNIAYPESKTGIECDAIGVSLIASFSTILFLRVTNDYSEDAGRMTQILEMADFYQKILPVLLQETAPYKRI